MVDLFNIIVDNLLHCFVSDDLLNQSIGIANWSFKYIDIFRLFYVIAVSWVLVFIFVILPLKIFKKLCHYKDIKRG